MSVITFSPGNLHTQRFENGNKADLMWTVKWLLRSSLCEVWRREKEAHTPDNPIDHRISAFCNNIHPDCVEGLESRSLEGYSWINPPSTLRHILYDGDHKTSSFIAGIRSLVTGVSSECQVARVREGGFSGWVSCLLPVVSCWFSENMFSSFALSSSSSELWTTVHGVLLV